MINKNVILLLFVIVTIPSKSFSQKTERRSVYESTKPSIKRTEWEMLFGTQTKNWCIYTRISKVNDTEYLDLKIWKKDGDLIIGKEKDLLLRLDKKGNIVFSNQLYNEPV